MTAQCIMVPLCSKVIAFHWRHNERDGVSNHQPHHCSLSCLFRRRSRKTSKLGDNGPCEGNSPMTGEFPYKGQVTRKMFPFDDVIIPHPPSSNHLPPLLARAVSSYSHFRSANTTNIITTYKLIIVLSVSQVSRLDITMTSHERQPV